MQRMQMRFPSRNFLNAFDRRFQQTFEWMEGRLGNRGIRVGRLNTDCVLT